MQASRYGWQGNGGEEAVRVVGGLHGAESCRVRPVRLGELVVRLGVEEVGIPAGQRLRAQQLIGVIGPSAVDVAGVVGPP